MKNAIAQSATANDDGLDVRERFAQYISTCEPGKIVDWTSITMATGISLHDDAAMKALFRKECRRQNRHFENLACGEGVEFSGSKNALGMALHKREKVVRAAHRAQKFAKGLLKEHVETLSTEDKHALDREVALGGAIKAFSSTGTAPVLPAGAAEAEKSRARTAALAQSTKMFASSAVAGDAE